jgi:hypothetical protein
MSTQPNSASTRTGAQPPPTLPLLVFEDYFTLPLTPIGSLLDIPVVATPKAWLNPVLMAAPMLIATFILAPQIGLLDRIALTAFWALLGLGTSFVHSIGHIIGGKLAGAPMDRLVVTMTRQPNVYDGDQAHYPARVHVLRAAGGPAANLVVGLAAGLLLLVAGYTPTLLVIAGLNIGFALGALAPVPSVDGEILARYLRGS